MATSFLHEQGVARLLVCGASFVFLDVNSRYTWARCVIVRCCFYKLCSTAVSGHGCLQFRVSGLATSAISFSNIYVSGVQLP